MTLPEHPIGLAQLADDLLGGMPASLHACLSLLAHDRGREELSQAPDRTYGVTPEQLGDGEDQSLVPRDAALADDLLDAIHHELAGGKPRPVARLGPPETDIGPFVALLGSGQQRAWFKSAIARAELYDKAAGTLLREAGAAVRVVGLYLYPPRYYPDESPPP